MNPTFTPPVAIIANGPIENLEYLKRRLKQFKTLIAVDGGLNHCRQLKITPQFIIGDMDSIHPDLLKAYDHVPKKSFPQDKNETDVELAITSIINQKIKESTLFCALKMRTDHTLYNLYLLSKYSDFLTIETEFETLFVVKHNQFIRCKAGQTVSLLPLGSPAKGVNSSGLKWELRNKTINQDFMSISNISPGGTFSVSIEEGQLLCFLIK